MTVKEFSRKYLITNEVLNATTHGIAALLAIVGLVFLLIRGNQLNSTVHIIAYSLYGATLILLFLSSCLYHSLIFTRAKKIFQVFDHSSIFLLIAGSYTPYCLLAIGGPLGIGMLIAVWTLAILGVIYKSIAIPKSKGVNHLSTIIYVLMGWLCLIAVRPLYEALGTQGIVLLVLGGVSYTVGAIFYSFKQVKFMHVVWHLFVMLGAGFMFFSIFLTT